MTIIFINFNAVILLLASLDSLLSIYFILPYLTIFIMQITKRFKWMRKWKSNINLLKKKRQNRALKVVCTWIIITPSSVMTSSFTISTNMVEIISSMLTTKSVAEDMTLTQV